MKEDITKPQLALMAIAIFAFVGAVLVCTEPTIPYFWIKLTCFAGVGGLCLLFSQHRLAVVLAAILFIASRLIF